MSSPFNKPSESDGLGPKVTDFEGALCIFTYRSEGEMKTNFGIKPYVEVDIDCVEGVAEGTLSKMMKQGSYPPEYPVLHDLTDQSATKVLIFQGFLRGSFRGRKPGDLILGRVQVEGKVTRVSTNEKDKKASFVLVDANEAETAKAVAYLNRKTASQLSGSHSQSNDEPDF